MEEKTINEWSQILNNEVIPAAFDWVDEEIDKWVQEADDCEEYMEYLKSDIETAEDWFENNFDDWFFENNWSFDVEEDIPEDLMYEFWKELSLKIEERVNDTLEYLSDTYDNFND